MLKQSTVEQVRRMGGAGIVCLLGVGLFITGTHWVISSGDQFSETVGLRLTGKVGSCNKSDQSSWSGTGCQNTTDCWEYWNDNISSGNKAKTVSNLACKQGKAGSCTGSVTQLQLCN